MIITIQMTSLNTVLRAHVSLSVRKAGTNSVNDSSRHLHEVFFFFLFSSAFVSSLNITPKELGQLDGCVAYSVVSKETTGMAAPWSSLSLVFGNNKQYRFLNPRSSALCHR